MPGTSRGSGRQAESRVPGTSTRKTADEIINELWAADSSDLASGDAPAFLRNNKQAIQKHRTPERRAFLENSRYVDQWGDWHTHDGMGNPKSYRIDYGLLNFLSECAYTFEEVSGRVLQFRDPQTMSDEYFGVICYLAARWQTTNYLANSKSRRMVISWTKRQINAWSALMHTGCSIYVASIDLEKSEEMVNRCRFILEHIPPECIPKHVLPPIEVQRGKSQAGRHDLVNRITIRHSEHEAGVLDSFIQAVPASDDLRGVGASEVELEEFAFWKNGKSVWDGLTGTLIGSGTGDSRTQGKIGMVSTPNPGHMRDIVLDRLGAS